MPRNRKMNREMTVTDFHTHPFLNNESNICRHTDYCAMSPEDTRMRLENLGISRICGSVIYKPEDSGSAWSTILKCNNDMLKLKELYGEFYVPGFHINPDYVEESCLEIERMHSLGVNLIGELVPSIHNWKNDYASKAFDEILDLAKQYDMVISVHSMNDDAMDKMVEKHPDIVFVAAHPGEYDTFMRHMARMKMSDNYYLDLSGTGIFRYGMLRHGIDLFGADRFIFGTDFPVCNPAVYVGGILYDSLLTDNEKELIAYKNAERIIGRDF